MLIPLVVLVALPLPVQDPGSLPEPSKALPLPLLVPIQEDPVPSRYTVDLDPIFDIPCALNCMVLSPLVVPTRTGLGELESKLDPRTWLGLLRPFPYGDPPVPSCNCASVGGGSSGGELERAKGSESSRDGNMNCIAASSPGPKARLYAELFAGGICEYGIPFGESFKEPLLCVLLRPPLVGVPLLLVLPLLLNMNGFGA